MPLRRHRFYFFDALEKASVVAENMAQTPCASLFAPFHVNRLIDLAQNFFQVVEWWGGGVEIINFLAYMYIIMYAGTHSLLEIYSTISTTPPLKSIFRR